VNLLFGTEEPTLYVCGDAQNMSKDLNETIIQSTAKILGSVISIIIPFHPWLHCDLFLRIVMLAFSGSLFSNSSQSAFDYSRRNVYPENTHRWGKHHCTAGLQFNKTGTDQ